MLHPAIIDGPILFNVFEVYMYNWRAHSVGIQQCTTNLNLLSVKYDFVVFAIGIYSISLHFNGTMMKPGDVNDGNQHESSG